MTASCDAARVAERNAQAKILERASWLQAKRRDQQHAVKVMSMRTFQSAMLMAPYYPCMYTLEKRPSVSVKFDGSKWVCGLAELSSSMPCIVYSLGSNYDTVFEDMVSKSTQNACEFFIYDPTLAVTRSQAELDRWRAGLPKNYHILELAITGNESATALQFRSPYYSGVRSYPATTLEKAMRANGHASATMLKIDIDGFELELLRTAPWDQLRFGLILFEVHPTQHAAGQKDLELRFSMVHEAFGLLELAGYRMYSAEPVYVDLRGAGCWRLGRSRSFTGTGVREQASPYRRVETSRARGGSGCGRHLTSIVISSERLLHES